MIQEVTVNSKQVLVALSGNIHAEEAKAMRESLVGYIDRGHKTILLNLLAVDFIDIAGLGALVAIHKRALETGGHLKIRGLQGNVKNLFESTQLNKVFEII